MTGSLLAPVADDQTVEEYKNQGANHVGGPIAPFPTVRPARKNRDQAQNQADPNQSGYGHRPYLGTALTAANWTAYGLNGPDPI